MQFERIFIVVFMKNREKKSEHQVELFARIEKTLPGNLSLVHQVGDLLELENDAIYRRIRGEVLMDIEETIKVCQKFQISLDSVVGVINQNQNLIQCAYTPLNLNDMMDFISFVQAASDKFENTSLSPEGEILLSAVDIPIFNLLPYRELTMFKLFSWSKSTYGFTADFDSFVKETEAFESLNHHYEKIERNYQSIPTTEIWTTSTIDPILRLLSYHFEMIHFSNKKTPLLLCDQLLNMLNTLQNWANNGNKGPKDIPFRLYISETDIGNTFILFKNGKKSHCLIKLYTINGLGISDDRFCQETEMWLRSTAQRGTLISGASEKERHKFFNAQRQKIELLKREIQHA